MFQSSSHLSPFLSPPLPPSPSLTHSLYFPSTLQKPSTVGFKMKEQCSSLVEALMACNPHYVRCIKPNDEKVRTWITEEEDIKRNVNVWIVTCTPPLPLSLFLPPSFIPFNTIPLHFIFTFSVLECSIPHEWFIRSSILAFLKIFVSVVRAMHTGVMPSVCPLVCMYICMCTFVYIYICIYHLYSLIPPFLAYLLYTHDADKNFIDSMNDTRFLYPCPSAKAKQVSVVW